MLELTLWVMEELSQAGNWEATQTLANRKSQAEGQREKEALPEPQPEVLGGSWNPGESPGPNGRATAGDAARPPTAEQEKRPSHIQSPSSQKPEK